MIKVSVVVPVYNVEKYLEKCLNSIFDQPFKDIEVIAVNDGSTDGSKKILEKYKKNEKRLVVFEQKNAGLSMARNKGMKHAKGKYILFVDSDDYINRDTLEKAYNIMEKNKLDILYWNIEKIYETGTKSQPIFSKVYNKDDDKGYLLSDPAAWNKMYRTDLFAKNDLEFLKGIYYEDFALMPRLIKYTNKIMYTPEISSNYVQSPNSITRKKEYNEKIMDIMIGYQLLYDDLYPKYKDELEYIAINQLLYSKTMELSKYNRLEEINRIIDYLNNLFPKWKNNKYYKNRNKLIKLYCNLINKKKYRTAKALMKCRNIIRK